MKNSPSNLRSIHNSPRLMLFDLALGGHHGNYIRYLIDRAYQEGFEGAIDIVVLPQFSEVHQDTIASISFDKNPTINLVPISAAESAALSSRRSGISRAFRNLQEWKIFCKYAKDLQTTLALIMYLDTCELPLTIGMKSPCPFSGIYFRPTFHYSMFKNNYFNQKDKLQCWRERLTWKRIFTHPQLQTVFCLDPFAVNELAAQHPHKKVIPLADPVQPSSDLLSDFRQAKTKLGIEANRRVLLLFGGLDRRKGINQILDAFQLLQSEACKHFCLLIVGQAHTTDQANIHQKIMVLRQNKPLQVIERYEFIPEADVSTYFQLADIILALYQRHVGMSGILLLAAAAGKPVLSSDYGLMGELARRFQLGLVVDSTKPIEIAKVLTTCVSVSPQNLFNFSQAQLFAEQNSINLYASTIFQHIFHDRIQFNR